MESECPATVEVIVCCLDDGITTGTSGAVAGICEELEVELNAVGLTFSFEECTLFLVSEC